MGLNSANVTTEIEPKNATRSLAARESYDKLQVMGYNLHVKVTNYTLSATKRAANMHDVVRPGIGLYR